MQKECDKKLQTIYNFPMFFEKGKYFKFIQVFDVICCSLNKMQAQNNLVERPLVLDVCQKNFEGTTYS